MRSNPLVAEERCCLLLKRVTEQRTEEGRMTLGASKDGAKGKSKAKATVNPANVSMDYKREGSVFKNQHQG